jgi:hypothetical protein
MYPPRRNRHLDQADHAAIAGQEHQLSAIMPRMKVQPKTWNRMKSPATPA